MEIESISLGKNKSMIECRRLWITLFLYNVEFINTCIYILLSTIAVSMFCFENRHCTSFTIFFVFNMQASVQMEYNSL